MVAPGSPLIEQHRTYRRHALTQLPTPRGNSASPPLDTRHRAIDHGVNAPSQARVSQNSGISPLLKADD
jgi:hypothetical protein